MRIGYLSTLYHTSHMLKAKGLVRAEWKIYGTGMEIVKALEEKRIDLAYVGLTPVIFAIDKGVDIFCISGGHVEGTVIAGRFEGRFPDCLESKKIGVPARGSIHDVILRSYLAELDFQVVNYPWAEMILDDFAEGKLDGVCGTPNLAILAKRYGAVICGRPSDIWPWNPSYGIAVRRDFFEESCDTLREFLIKHEWATNILREAVDYSGAFLENYIRGELDHLTIKDMLTLSPKYCASLPDEYVSSTQTLAALMKKLGYVENSLKKSDVFNFDLISEVHPQREHYSVWKNGKTEK
ncbi:ABC transporter substrate-binding protein [Geoglobus acetivorans]|uniref:ABC transporter substrate-binding protein n=1 Tax=Geoglobus acetivorans TaxID=565033 RepID=A0ABZ3H423_GEOAI|nr:ABC transporter substrate-binding protein [Geoglobus acetivorans]